MKSIIVIPRIYIPPNKVIKTKKDYNRQRDKKVHYD